MAQHGEIKVTIRGKFGDDSSRARASELLRRAASEEAMAESRFGSPHSNSTLDDYRASQMAVAGYRAEALTVLLMAQVDAGR